MIATNKTELTPEKLLQAFLRYPLSNIPILKDEAILGYISKAKTLRKANTESFFDSKLEVSLKDILIEMNKEEFFLEIDDKKIQDIPYFNSNDFSLDVFALQDFNLLFRPVEKIELLDFEKLLTGFPLPVIIYNSRNKLIYQNGACDDLHKMFIDATDVNRKNILDYFSSGFFSKTHDKDPSQIEVVRVGKTRIKFKRAIVSLNGGVAFMVTFVV